MPALTPEQLSVIAANQIWKCQKCFQLRSWGMLEPEDRSNQPLLRCKNCRKATRHVFDHISATNSRDRGYE